MQRRDVIWLLGGTAIGHLRRMRSSPADAAHRRADGACRSDEFHAYVAAFREDSRSSGGRKAATSVSTFAGAHSMTQTRGRCAKELIELQPEIILTQNIPPTASMLQQTRTIPVVFVVVSDPVGSGFVQNLARPGGNATGFTTMGPTIIGKWLELLKEIAPRSNRAAMWLNPERAISNIYLAVKAAAASLRSEAIAATVRQG